MEKQLKQFKAMIWKDDPNEPGKRVYIFAESLRAAKEMLEKQYGTGSVYDLHCEEDAARPR